MKSIIKDNIPFELYQSSIFLYGAGITGRRILDILKQYQLNILYVIDDDASKIGSLVEGVEIISFQQLENLCTQYEKISVILSTIYGKVVIKKLYNLTDLAELEIYEMYDWLNENYGLHYELEGINNKQNLKEFNKRIISLQKRLADKVSSEVLEGIYGYLCTNDINCISNICTEDEQYFIPEVLSAIHKPLNLVDGGAYTGELYQKIKDFNIKLEHWYCFEADSENYNKLLIQTEKMNLGGVQICVKKGLWSEEGILYFDADKNTSSKIVDYETENQIETISLNKYFKNRNCNFIKMDIEGAEYAALCGAIDIIKRDRPILAISIYHSLEDYYRIPEFLMDDLQNYSFYIRHHALILCETVLYAIPNELI